MIFMFFFNMINALILPVGFYPQFRVIYDWEWWECERTILRT